MKRHIVYKEHTYVYTKKKGGGDRSDSSYTLEESYSIPLKFA